MSPEFILASSSPRQPYALVTRSHFIRISSRLHAASFGADADKVGHIVDIRVGLRRIAADTIIYTAIALEQRGSFVSIVQLFTSESQA